jgi:hypothetical protein
VKEAKSDLVEFEMRVVAPKRQNIDLEEEEDLEKFDKEHSLRQHGWNAGRLLDKFEKEEKNLAQDFERKSKERDEERLEEWTSEHHPGRYTHGLDEGQ